ncbi:MAG: GTP 3',8-cyclase MoaA [Pseudomonadota bacterium]
MADLDPHTSPLPLTDNFGRNITYLRLSVTDRCDLRCSYCMSEHMSFLPKKELLTLEELEHVSAAFIARGVKKIRVTGGEPLVRKNILSLFKNLGQYLGKGLDELTLTTNGTLLNQYADDLKACGVNRINISLDTIDPDRFKSITRIGNLDVVLRGIDAALNAGLQVKINTVALKNDNSNDLVDMISWVHSKKMEMTLIEVMPLGETGEDRQDQFIPLSVIRDQLEERFSVEDIHRKDENAGPSRYVRIKETGGKLGFITPLTNNFCANCNRIRVTCTGRIYMCLGQNDHVDLRAVLRQSDAPHLALNKAMDTAMFRKPEKHEFVQQHRQTLPSLARHMSVTGG